jgi:hypothetical protein
MKAGKKSKIRAILVLISLMFGAGVRGNACVADTAADHALLQKFALLCGRIRDVKGNYTLAGVISITDPTQPAGNMDHIQFLFCKRGGEYCYKLGSTTTLNENGAYVYIDHQNKRILVSGQKQVTYDNGVKGFGDLGAQLKFEHYKVGSKVSGNDETISLTNEHHISCKQYAITFDKRNMKIKRLYLRLSNLSDPLRTDNEKIVSVSITEWTKTAVLSKYLTKDQVIRIVRGEWATTSEFKQYRLIKM